MCLSGIFFYNESSDLILGRFYKPDITKLHTEAFREKVLVPRKFTEPVVQIDGCSFLFIRSESIYVVCATKLNGNPSLIFQFLYDVVDVLKVYFDGKFDEPSFRNNFCLIYELLDEVMDNGFPQITSADLLQGYIKTTNKDVSLRARLKKMKLNDSLTSPGKTKRNDSNETNKKMKDITAAITGRMDWRLPPMSNYSYNKNEVYLDVLEEVNLLMSRTGDILQMSANGFVKMKALLSGMPECRIGINDIVSLMQNPNTNNTAKTKKASNYIKLNDIKLHRCVRLGQFDEDRSILFVPPDGEYELMRYSVSNLSLPFYVRPNVVERGSPTTRIVYDIKLEAKFSRSMYASDIIMYIPTPQNTNNCNIKVDHGKTSYDPTKHCIEWKIKKIYGDSFALLKGEVELTRLMVDRQWEKPPIKMDFEVRMLAASGMKIRYLKVTEKELQYKTAKWVRYITNAGSYQIRI